MMRKKSEAPQKDNTDRWMITYSDLITLLLIFFVVMYSISNVNAQKMQAVANSLSVVLTGRALSILDFAGPSVIEGSAGTSLEQIAQEVAEYIESQELIDQDLGNNILILEQERGLVISIKDTVLFASGSDALSPKAQEIIYQVGKTLVDIPNYIRVEGHTDNLPIHTAKFPSNWELSVLRATNVAHVLIDRCGISPERVSASGYGEYRPLVPNTSDANRAMNRRVDIVILKEKYNYFEPAESASSQ